MKLMNRTLFAGVVATGLLAGGNSILAQSYQAGVETRTGKASSRDGTLSAGEARFLRDAADANQAEIEMGRLGVQKGQSADVKQFAQKVVDEHSAQLKQVQQLAQQKGVELRTKTSMRDHWEINRLKDASAKDFDKDFAKYMV